MKRILRTIGRLFKGINERLQLYGLEIENKVSEIIKIIIYKEQSETTVKELKEHLNLLKEKEGITESNIIVTEMLVPLYCTAFFKKKYAFAHLIAKCGIIDPNRFYSFPQKDLHLKNGKLKVKKVNCSMTPAMLLAKDHDIKSLEIYLNSNLGADLHIQNSLGQNLMQFIQYRMNGCFMPPEKLVFKNILDQLNSYDKSNPKKFDFDITNNMVKNFENANTRNSTVDHSVVTRINQFFSSKKKKLSPK